MNYNKEYNVFWGIEEEIIEDNKKYKLLLGDNIASLKQLEPNSIDSVVTDPPYGLKFMNKTWDYQVPSVEFWKEVYRVLKPGGHVCSFGGTRTYHRMVVNCEDAGFEVRDCISWLYGSGFPKSHNIGKAIDKSKPKNVDDISKAILESGISISKIAKELNVSNQLVNFWISKERTIQPNEIDKLNKLLNIELEYTDDLREVIGINENAISGWNNKVERDILKGTSEDAIKWEGWGSALKPAVELILLARKPLSEGTIADNVLKWNTGGLNIDGSRIETTDNLNERYKYNFNNSIKYEGDNKIYGGGKGLISEDKIIDNSHEGRFPANLILDEEAAQALDLQSGVSKSNCKSGVVKDKEANVFNDGINKTSGHKEKMMVGDYSDTGGASRYFKIIEGDRFQYIPKVSKKERNLGCEELEEKEVSVNSANRPPKDEEYSKKRTQTSHNQHPTVKPVKLMAYLCKLITPPDGIILDPFMGSGSTGIAAALEGFNFIGMEMNEDYMKIAEARIYSWEKYKKIIK